MASWSYPHSEYNDGAVSDLEYERLAMPQASDGVFGHPADQPILYADGTGLRAVRIRAERRVRVRGFVYESGPEDIPLTLAANTSGVNRYDLVVLRLDRATWRVRETVVQGQPGSGVPSYDRSGGATGVFEFPLGHALVTPNATTVTGDRVTPLAWYIGDDGQIRCTSTTRPPGEAGRQIWEHPGGVQYVSTGSKWLRVAEDSGTAKLTMVSGYTGHHNTLYRRNGWVLMQLTMWRDAATMKASTPYHVATIPSGFRPPFYIQGTGLERDGVVTTGIHADGKVICNPGVNDIPTKAQIVFSALAWPVT